MKGQDRMQLSLGVLNSTPKQGFMKSHPGDDVDKAIGFIVTHHVNFCFIYKEEAQNLKEGKWYPYKVFFATPYGWLKVDGSELVFMRETAYILTPVETSIVLKQWRERGNVEAIIKILGFSASNNQGDKDEKITD